MAALKLPRRAYVPGDRPVRVRQYDDVPATVVTYTDDHDRPYAAAWRGKAQKPALHFRFTSADNSVRMTSYSWAHLWNGEPKAQTGFGWGH